MDDVGDVDVLMRKCELANCRIEGQKNAYMQAGQAKRLINAMNCSPVWRAGCLPLYQQKRQKTDPFGAHWHLTYIYIYIYILKLN